MCDKNCGNNQDHNKYVLKKKNTEKKYPTDSIIKSTNNSTNEEYDQNPNDKMKVLLFGKECGTLLQQARIDKFPTQKDFANRCQLPLNIIKDYENGTAQYKPSEVNKMARVLGITLCRPNKEN